MDLATILLISLTLALDCFAVALAAGIESGRAGLRNAARIALAFGSFQAGMPFLGWLAGSSVIGLISGYDHWLAFALLSIVGVHMIREGASPSSSERTVSLDTASLLILAVTTSIDALAVGVSLAFIQAGILVPCLIIGLSTFAISLFGALIGGAAARRWGDAMEVAGGIVLIGIGVRILIIHMAP